MPGTYQKVSSALGLACGEAVIEGRVDLWGLERPGGRWEVLLELNHVSFSSRNCEPALCHEPPACPTGCVSLSLASPPGVVCPGAYLSHLLAGLCSGHWCTSPCALLCAACVHTGWAVPVLTASCHPWEMLWVELSKGSEGLCFEGDRRSFAVTPWTGSETRWCLRPGHNFQC